MINSLFSDELKLFLVGFVIAFFSNVVVLVLKLYQSVVLMLYSSCKSSTTSVSVELWPISSATCLESPGLFFEILSKNRSLIVVFATSSVIVIVKVSKAVM